nr:MAG TPA: hypothetical protein [Caudoviricetes sp.]
MPYFCRQKKIAASPSKGSGFSYFSYFSYSFLNHLIVVTHYHSKTV